MKTKLTPMQTMGINNSCKDVGSDLSAGHYGFEIVDKPKELVDSLSYPSYRLHYVIQGGVTLYYAGKKVALKKNSVFVLMPNTSVSYQVENKKWLILKVEQINLKRNTTWTKKWAFLRAYFLLKIKHEKF